MLLAGPGVCLAAAFIQKPFSDVVVSWADFHFFLVCCLSTWEKLHWIFQTSGVSLACVWFSGLSCCFHPASLAFRVRMPLSTFLLKVIQEKSLELKGGLSMRLVRNCSCGRGSWQRWERLVLWSANFKAQWCLQLNSSKLLSAWGQKYIAYIPQRIVLNGEEVYGIIP